MKQVMVPPEIDVVVELQVSGSVTRLGPLCDPGQETPPTPESGPLRPWDSYQGLGAGAKKEEPLTPSNPKTMRMGRVVVDP